MTTLTISTALVRDITDSVTYRTAADSIWEYPNNDTNGGQNSLPSAISARVVDSNTNHKGSFLAAYAVTGSAFNWSSAISTDVRFEFKNSSNTTLVSYTAAEILSRTMDNDGYCVLTNFPQKTPSVAGTISYVLITNGNVGSFTREVILLVGSPGSGSDVEFDDRVLVTNQPWRLDGSIKFRAPITYTWTT
jgi:hypothetical protein